MSHILIVCTVLSLLAVLTVLKCAQLWPEHAIRSGLLAVGVLMVAILPTVLMRYQVHIAAPISWFSMVVMGFWATFLIVTLLLDFFLLIRRMRKRPYQVGRRQFLYRTALGASAGMSALGAHEALAGPHIIEVEVPIHNLPHAFDGFKIAQITDLHIGSSIQRDYVERTAQLVERTVPDLIVFTGDFADGYAHDLLEQTEPLGRLQASAGKFYVTGNHEHYWGAQAWIERAQALGFQALVNTSQTVQWQNTQILITGADDPGLDPYDPVYHTRLNQMFAEVGEGRESSGLRLFLNHRPLQYEEAERHGFHLQLSGHTHGGQFFPLNWLIALTYRYYRGLYPHGGLWVYVSSGTGYWGTLDRLAVPSEVTLLRLRRA